MDAQMLERRIDDLLDDPMVSLMIEADGVDRAGLARQLRGIAPRAARLQGRDKRPQPLWRRLSPVLCAACAP
jgi:hypothetical protein